MQKMEGESLWDFVTIRRRVDRQGVVPDCYKRNSQICIDQPRVFRTMNTFFWMLQSQVLGQGTTTKALRFFVEHCPLSVYLSYKSFRPSTSIFAHHKWSKLEAGTTWEWGNILTCNSECSMCSQFWENVVFFRVEVNSKLSVQAIKQASMC